MQIEANAIAEMALTAVAKESINRLVAKLQKRDKPRIDSVIVEGRLQLQAQQIGQVKTLLSTDAHVAIEKFYCTPRVAFGGDSFIPHSADSFKYDQVLIEGVAGQGKSILLRALCSQSILKGGRIAFFFELRKLDYLKPLHQILFESLVELGLPGNSEALKSLALEKGLEIYLDGFDEIDQRQAEKIDRDISFFASNYQFVRIFVSSRPHVGLSKNNNFFSYRIEDLNAKDVKRLIEKISQDPGLADALNKKLARHEGRAMELLETPLLVTLLVAQYAQTQQIPEQLSEFYESIFHLLFEKHDSFKTPFQRTKRVAVTTYTYKKIFQKFCFASLFSSNLPVDTAIKLAAWALVGVASDANGEDFLNDVSDISSLVNEEGGSWSFIHGSVQEYYAAAFMMAGSDGELQSHAGKLRGIPNDTAREQVFRFARELEERRFIEHVELPFYRDLLMPLKDEDELTDKNCVRWLACHAERVIEDKNRIDEGWFFSVWLSLASDKPIRFFVSPEASAVVAGIIGSDMPVSEKVRNLSVVKTIEVRMATQVREKLAAYKAIVAADVERLRDWQRERKRDDDFLKALLDG